MKKKIVLIVLVLAVLVFTACGSNMSAPTADSAPAEAADTSLRAAAPRSETAAGMTPVPTSAPPLLTEAEDVLEQAETDHFLFPILTPSTAGDRRLVYTITMRLQTTEFLQGMGLLGRTVGELDGYTVSRSVRGYDMRAPHRTERSAEMRFRIPTERLSEFLFMVENNYNIWGLEEGIEERTVAYRQTGWNLDDLREQEAQLLEALETAQGDAYIAASNSLRDVRHAIRDLEMSQAAIMDDVVYSTVDIQLFEAVLPEGRIPLITLSPTAGLIIALVLAVITLTVILLVMRKSTTKTAPSGTAPPQ